MNSTIDFLLNAGKLKKVKRAGWVLRNVPDAESVAEHSFRTALICMMMGNNVNRERCIKIALIHDLAEALVGDITPVDGVPKEAELVHSSDKLELALQAYEYEKEYGSINLEEFWKSAEARIEDGKIMELFRELKGMRRG